MFNDKFYIKQINEQTQLNEIYRLRYSVYCEEFGYESLNNSGLEKDELDKYSIHIGLFCKTNDKLIGCVRLIPADICRIPIEKLNLNIQIFDKANSLEVSRLIIHRDYRGKIFDFPVIIILFIKLLLVAKEINKNLVFMLIDYRLAKLLNRIGLELREYEKNVYKDRSVYLLDLNSINRQIIKRYVKLINLIKKSGKD